MRTSPDIGSIAWTDLTIANADEIRSFYSQVVGWKHEPVDMMGYSDFNMLAPATAKPTAGICHARGVNEGLPPQRLIDIADENLDNSAHECLRLGEAFRSILQSKALMR